MVAVVGAPPRPRSRTPHRSVPGAARGWVVAAGAAWAWLFLEAVRVWFPSVLHTVGGPAATRSTVPMIAVSFASVAAPLALVPALRRIPPGAAWVGGLLVLAATRLAMPLSAGVVQLTLSAVAVAAGVVALAGLAAGVPSGHLARLGLIAGVAGSVAVHAGLGTLDLAWRSGAATWTATAGVVALVLAVAHRARRVPLWWPTPTNGGGMTAVWTRGPAWPWLVVGPTLSLVLMLVAVPARLELAAGWTPARSTAALTLAGGAAVVVAVAARRASGPLPGAAGATVVLLATLVALQPTDVTAAVGQLGILVGCGAVVGALGRTAGDSGPRRRALAVTSSMLGFWALTVAYFAGFAVPTTIPSRVWLVVAAAAVASLGGAAAWASRTLGPDRRPVARTLVTVTALTGLLAVAGAAVTPAADAPGEPVRIGDELRIATFNVRSGFGADGRFDPDAVAAAIRAQDADVVVLNEVDRGWLIEGGHDLLRLLTVRTGLEHTAFVPAADAVWGNAVLSRVPLGDVRSGSLPRGGTAMTRSWVSATIDLGDGGQIGVIGTQFHPRPDGARVRLAQARGIAAEAARLAGRGTAVVVVGELAAEASDPELEPLSFLTAPDADPRRAPTDTGGVDRARTAGARLLVAPELTVRDVTVTDTLAGGGPPVGLTVTRGERSRG